MAEIELRGLSLRRDRQQDGGVGSSFAVAAGLGHCRPGADPRDRNGNGAPEQQVIAGVFVLGGMNGGGCWDAKVGKP